MTYFKNKTIIMSGGSRGVGLEIAKALGKDGANVAILAKTKEPHPTLPGTIFTAADEIKEVGGNPLPIVCDIRFEDQVEAAVEETASKFGGIDICINNASAIHLTDTVNTPMKRYDLMHNINVMHQVISLHRCIHSISKMYSACIINAYVYTTKLTCCFLNSSLYLIFKSNITNYWKWIASNFLNFICSCKDCSWECWMWFFSFR